MLLAEPTHNSRQAREKAVELLFEKFKVPAAFLAKAAVLSSFAVGKQTSLVVDAGYQATTSEWASSWDLLLGCVAWLKCFVHCLCSEASFGMLALNLSSVHWC